MMCILAVGDLYQLPPVGQPLLFNSVSDGYAQLYGSGSIWVDDHETASIWVDDHETAR